MTHPEILLPVLLSIVVVLYAGGAIVLMARVLSARSAPIYQSFRIALLGPPQSGKTTSLICLLDEASRCTRPGVVKMRGERTIERVAQGIHALSTGNFPPATREDETNVYRFDFRANASFPLEVLMATMYASRHFRVEIADFAGEHTERFFGADLASNETAPPDEFSMDSSQNFLKWLSESDRCLLYLDCEEMVRLGAEYVSYITTRYIALWQRYLDLHIDKLDVRTGAPVVLVCSKADVLLEGRTIVDDEDAVRHTEEKLRGQFHVLYEYLRNNARWVDLIPFSALTRGPDGERLGVMRLLEAVLPRRRPVNRPASVRID